MMEESDANLLEPSISRSFTMPNIGPNPIPITSKSLKQDGVGFPGGSVVKNLPANAGDMGSIPDPGRFHMPWSNYVHGPQLLSLGSRVWEP